MWSYNRPMQELEEKFFAFAMTHRAKYWSFLNPSDTQFAVLLQIVQSKDLSPLSLLTVWFFVKWQPSSAMTFPLSCGESHESVELVNSKSYCTTPSKGIVFIDALTNTGVG